jgi:hypothetical protein
MDSLVNATVTPDNATPDQTTGTSPAVPPIPPAPPAAPAAGEGKEPTDVASLPAWAQKLLADTRKEAADNRVKANEIETQRQATLDAIATALGVKKEDDPAQAAKTAAEERDAARLEARTVRLENAILKSAPKIGANPEALADSRTFMKAVADLDPAADDFAAQIETAITTALEANATLKLDTGPVRSGGELKPGPPAPGQLTREDLQGMTPEEIMKAKAEGRCNQMLGIT